MFILISKIDPPKISDEYVNSCKKNFFSFFFVFVLNNYMISLSIFNFQETPHLILYFIYFLEKNADI